MTKALLAALLVCAAAAALEGAFAGRGVRRRLDALKQPPGSPPFRFWVGIGLFYYFVCAVVLTRLFHLTRSRLWWATFATILVLLFVNALWNLAFFRLGNLEATVRIHFAYAAVALASAVLLSRLDPVSAWVFAPYLIYLIYATWWMLSVRQLNR